MSNLLDRLREAIGAAYVLTEPADVAAYALDWRGRYQGTPLCVVRPGTRDEVARVVSLCAEAGSPMVPQGGNTGLCGGATPVANEVVISLTRLNRIVASDADNNTLAVESGCTLHQVQEAAKAIGRFFPLSLASEGTATIGGNLSTNAGGVQVLRYGSTRDLVLGVEAVLPDGRLWNGLRGLRKDNTGYDLKQLFIGAEGTLGLITAVVLKLFPLPRVTVTAWVAVQDPAAAVALLSQLRATVGDRVSAFELIGRSALDLVLRHIPDSRDPLGGNTAWQVLLELSDTMDTDLAGALQAVLAGALETGIVKDAVIAQSETQAARLWALRENISEAQRIDGISIKHDIALPVSKVADFIETAGSTLRETYPNIRIVCFGHIGDGNLHYNLSKTEAMENPAFIAATPAVNRLVHDLVHEACGSISAEHGLGQLKREEILRYKTATEMNLMRSIKKALDPAGLMNPGKLL